MFKKDTQINKEKLEDVNMCISTLGCALIK